VALSHQASSGKQSRFHGKDGFMIDINNPTQLDPVADRLEIRVHQVLAQLAIGLGVPIQPKGVSRSDIQGDGNEAEPLRLLSVAAEQVDLFLAEADVRGPKDVFNLAAEGYPIILAYSDDSFAVFDRVVGRKIEGSLIAEHVEPFSLTRRQLRSQLTSEPPPRVLVAKRALECDSLSSSPASMGHEHNDHHHHHHHEHLPPLKRFLKLLVLDWRDIQLVLLFAAVAGVLALATPLAVESLVNVVSWGTFVQPLVVLAVILLTSLGLAGVLKVLQTIVVEMIQRRQFVRLVGDFTHRFPRASQQALEGEYPRELANRFFDIMTIQKATAGLLIDGVSIVLATTVGMLLLAFYHPFLLGFDLVLLLLMVSVTWLLGNGGIVTSIEESIAKYKVAHWLQDVLATPSAFKINGGESLAIRRTNQLTADYLHARERQFRIVLRQVAFAIGLQVIASSSLLGIGGWLVIQGQLTLGQLVASELVVTAVVGAFSKAGKSLETFYDVMAATDKVGHMLDVPAEPRSEIATIPDGPIEVSWSEIVFRWPGGNSRIAASNIPAGSRVAIVGDDVAGRSLLAKVLVGLKQPTSGLAQVGGFDSKQAGIGSEGRLVAYAGDRDIFCGTLRENIDLGRSGIGQHCVRDVLFQVGLSPVVLRLSKGLQTKLQTDGHPLSLNQCELITLARAMVGRPRLLVIDGLLDRLNDQDRARVWDVLTNDQAPWTLVVVTNRRDIAALCQSQVAVRVP